MAERTARRRGRPSHWRRLAGAMLLAALAGCATVAPTPYGPAPGDGAPGYADQRIEENRFEIRFSGNAATPRATVERYLLYRAAEVTLAAGADWFRFVERDTRPGPAALTPVPDGAGGPAGGGTESGAGAAPAAVAPTLGSAGQARAAKGKGGWKAAGPRGPGYRRAYRGGYRRGYRHGYGHGYRRSGGVRLGFSFGWPYYPYYPYGPYYGPYYGYGPWPYGRAYVPYTVRAAPPVYEAVAEILVFPGEKPDGDDRAYDAAAVVASLRPAIRFAPPPEGATGTPPAE